MYRSVFSIKTIICLRQDIVPILVKPLYTTIYKLIQALVLPFYIKTIIGMSFCSLFLFVAMQKEKVNRKRKTRIFICNPLDCSSPNGRTTCRCSILSLAPLGRGCPKDRRGAKILQSFTAPIITARSCYAALIPQ